MNGNLAPSRVRYRRSRAGTKAASRLHSPGTDPRLVPGEPAPKHQLRWARLHRARPGGRRSPCRARSTARVRLNRTAEPADTGTFRAGPGPRPRESRPPLPVPEPGPAAAALTSESLRGGRPRSRALLGGPAPPRALLLPGSGPGAPRPPPPPGSMSAASTAPSSREDSPLPLAGAAGRAGAAPPPCWEWHRGSVCCSGCSGGCVVAPPAGPTAAAASPPSAARPRWHQPARCPVGRGSSAPRGHLRCGTVLAPPYWERHFRPPVARGGGARPLEAAMLVVAGRASAARRGPDPKLRGQNKRTLKSRGSGGSDPKQKDPDGAQRAARPWQRDQVGFKPQVKGHRAAWRGPWRCLGVLGAPKPNSGWPQADPSPGLSHTSGSPRDCIRSLAQINNPQAKALHFS